MLSPGQGIAGVPGGSRQYHSALAALSAPLSCFPAVSVSMIEDPAPALRNDLTATLAHLAFETAPTKRQRQARTGRNRKRRREKRPRCSRRSWLPPEICSSPGF